MPAATHPAENPEPARVLAIVPADESAPACAQALQPHRVAGHEVRVLSVEPASPRQLADRLRVIVEDYAPTLVYAPSSAVHDPRRRALHAAVIDEVPRRVVVRRFGLEPAAAAA